MPIIPFATLDAVPEGLKEFAKTDEAGAVTVNVVASVKLDDFRNKNIELSKQIETTGPILARIKEIAGDDLDAFSSDLSGLRDVAKRVQDGELKTNDQIEAAVADRIANVRNGYEETSKALNRELVEEKKKAVSLGERLNRTRIDKEVTSVVILPNSGIRPEALPDVLERAYRLFKIEDDKLVPKKGESTVYGSDGASPMNVTEWIVKLRDEAPHYFKGNGGGGASGGDDKGKYGGLSKADFDKLPAMAKLQLANERK